MFHRCPVTLEVVVIMTSSCETNLVIFQRSVAGYRWRETSVCHSSCSFSQVSALVEIIDLNMNPMAFDCVDFILCWSLIPHSPCCFWWCDGNHPVRRRGESMTSQLNECCFMNAVTETNTQASPEFPDSNKQTVQTQTSWREHMTWSGAAQGGLQYANND